MDEPATLRLGLPRTFVPVVQSLKTFQDQPGSPIVLGYKEVEEAAECPLFVELPEGDTT